jgi:hypothetical protein
MLERDTNPSDPPEQWEDPGKPIEEGDVGSWKDPGKTEVKGGPDSQPLEDVLRDLKR